MHVEIKVGIVHPITAVSEALAASLQGETGILVVDLSENVAPLRHGSPADVVDLALVPAANEFEVLEERIQDAKRRASDARVLVFGVDNTKDGILACIEAGASAYALSNASLGELVDAIRTAHSGGMVCPPEVSSYLFERLASLKKEQGAVPHSKADHFTRRESQILQLVSDGLSNKEIASVLGLEVQTVKNYVHNILEKLRVRNRSAAASYARRAGLVETASIRH